MASEVISHAIFLPLPITPHPAPHCLPLRLPLHPRLSPRASLHIPPCISPFTSLHIPPCTPPSIPPELHLAPCTPLFTLLCAALLPPRIPSCPSPCAPTPFHTTHFHRTSLLPRIPLAKSLPPRHSIFLPSAHFPSASLHPPCSSAKPRLWIFSCVKRPGSLTT